VGEIARRLGLPLMPWQQTVIDVALELDGDGSYHYDEVVLTVPRQSGKTALILAMLVHRLVVMTRDLGRQRVTYTAQQRQKARLKMERDFAQTLRDARSFTEITHVRNRPSKVTEWKLSLNNGAENIQFGRGNYLQIDAPSRTGGHGDTLDVGVIDEAFAREDDTVETGMAPSMITRRSRQVWVVSTAGDERSVYLWRKILAGRKACRSHKHGRTAYFEWSAPEKADPSSPKVWRACMPALGHTVTERVIHGEWEKAVRGGDEGIDKFRRSYLNQWPRTPKLDEELAQLPMVRLWAAAADPAAERGARPVFGVDVDADRLAHVAVAWRRPDGRVQVMLADTDLSPLRTAERVAKLAGDWRGPVVLGGPSASLEGDVRRAQVISSTAFAAAFGRFCDLLNDDGLRHGNQPRLNAAVAVARDKSMPSGERSMQLRDAPGIGPLVAVVRSIHGLLLAPPKRAATPVAPTKATVDGRADVMSMLF
jgi:hypothetical protein